MKRSKKKLEVMKASGFDTSLPAELRRAEYFARLHGKHAKGYMKFIARKGAMATNAKRKLAATGIKGLGEQVDLGPVFSDKEKAEKYAKKHDVEELKVDIEA